MLFREILCLGLLVFVAVAVPVMPQLLLTCDEPVLSGDVTGMVSPPALLTSGQPVQPADGTRPEPPPPKGGG